jgi:hypothetical protein
MAREFLAVKAIFLAIRLARYKCPEIVAAAAVWAAMWDEFSTTL